MSDALLRLAEVCRRSGYSTSGLYAAMARGEFPRPRKRGHVSLWVESEVAAAIARDIAELPIAQLGGGARAPAAPHPCKGPSVWMTRALGSEAGIGRCWQA